MHSFSHYAAYLTKAAPWADSPPVAPPRPPAHRPKSRLRQPSAGGGDADWVSLRRAYVALRRERSRRTSAFLISLCSLTDDADATDAGPNRESSATAEVELRGLLAFIVYHCTYLTHWSRQQQQQQEKEKEEDGEWVSFPSFEAHVAAVYGGCTAWPAEATITTATSVNRTVPAYDAGLAAAMDAARRLWGPPAATLWRQPAVLASLTSLAEEVALLEAHNHSGSRSTGMDGGPPRTHEEEEEAEKEVLPCPLCYAAAVDDAMAAEAMWCLLELHRAFATPGASPSPQSERGNVKRNDDDDRRRRATAVAHAVAVCRIGLLNTQGDGECRSGAAVTAAGGVLSVVACRAVRHWLLAPWRKGLFSAACPAMTGRDMATTATTTATTSVSAATLMASQRGMVALTLTALIAQDEAAMHNDDDACGGGDSSSSGNSIVRASDGEDVARTLAALGQLLYAAVPAPPADPRGGSSSSSYSTDAAVALAGEWFLELTAATPFPWLRVDSCPASSSSQRQHQQQRGAATLLEWVCGRGHVLAARLVSNVVMDASDRAGGRAPQLWRGALSCALAAALASRSNGTPVKAALTRLLLLAGASPYTVPPEVLRACLTSGAAGDDDGSHRTLVELLHSPGVALDPPPPPQSQAPSLLQRIRLAATASSAADRLAQLAWRLWSEKVRQLSPFPQEGEPGEERDEEQQGQQGQQPASGSGGGFSAERMRAVAAAQDRVLRPALAALSFEPGHPAARLALAAVLGRKLRDWHRVQSTCPRALSSLTEQQRCDALIYYASVRRLYRELGPDSGSTGGDGGGVLSLTAAVAARRVVWEQHEALARARRDPAVEESDREQAAGHQPPSGSGGDEKEGGVHGGEEGPIGAAAKPTPPLVVEMERELRSVLADCAAIALHPNQQQGDGQQQESGGGGGGPVSQPLPPPPSHTEAVLSSSHSAVAARYVLVDLSAAAPVWVRVGAAIDFEATLAAAVEQRTAAEARAQQAEGGSGGVIVDGCYGLVDTDLPPQAPVQRGDLVVFTADKNSSSSANGGGGVSGRHFTAVRVVRATEAAVAAAAAVRVRCVLNRSCAAEASDDGDDDGAESPGPAVVVVVTLRAVLAPRWIETPEEEEEPGSLPSPLQWLEVQPPQRQQSAGDGRPLEGSAVVNAADAIAVLLSRRAMLGATVAGTLPGRGGQTLAPVWVQTAARRSNDNNDDGCGGYLADGPDCLWRRDCGCTPDERGSCPPPLWTTAAFGGSPALCVLLTGNGSRPSAGLRRVAGVFDGRFGL